MKRPPNNPDSEMFNRAIPGMSLTTEPGNRPWENPPMYSTVAEAIEYYNERLLDKNVTSAVAEALDKGVPVESAVQVITTSSTMNGVHSLDIGILVAPVVRELVMFAGDIHKVDYAMSFSDDAEEGLIPYRLAKQIAEDITTTIEEVPPEGDMMEEDSMDMEAPKGIMARRRIA